MELYEAVEEMKRRGVRRVFVQLPEGLKAKSLEISDFLEEKEIEAIICLENTYGACDLRDEEALRLGCDAILHIGHNDFGFEWLESKLPVFYVEWYFGREIEDSLEGIIRGLEGFKKIGVVYSLQYRKSFEKVLEFLRSRGKEVLTSGNGQIIGCNFSNALSIEEKVDAFLVVSSGRFHALGLALKSTKPVFLFDVEMGEIKRIDVNRERKILEWNKRVFEESQIVGLLVSWKRGQLRRFEDIRRNIEKLGKKVYILAFDELNESLLEGIKLDCLVNLACPRISVEDAERYKIPIINFLDLPNNFFSKKLC